MDTVEQNVIDCDADPFVPSGFTLESHIKGGQFVFDPAKIKLYLSPNQRGNKVIKGNKLREELANKPVLNANVLDYLLSHPHLIPEEWKRGAGGNARYIFFWGTIYLDLSSRPCVPYLCFGSGVWFSRYFGLGSAWDGGDPSAVRAS